ncbi:hypothetical protein D3C73_933260 [compost metagenome]
MFRTCLAPNFSPPLVTESELAEEADNATTGFFVPRATIFFTLSDCTCSSTIFSATSTPSSYVFSFFLTSTPSLPSWTTCSFPLRSSVSFFVSVAKAIDSVISSCSFLTLTIRISESVERAVAGSGDSLSSSPSAIFKSVNALSTVLAVV